MMSLALWSQVVGSLSFRTYRLVIAAFSRPVPVKTKGKRPWWLHSVIITTAIFFKSKIKGYADTMTILTWVGH